MTRELDASFAAIAASLRTSTVAVIDPRGRGAGSGIVWDRGLILTNAHVARAATAIIETASGRLRARVLRRDADIDLALLGIDGDPELVPATVRDSRTLVAGELLFAVGNPHGLPGTVTAGMLHRVNPRWVIADVRLAPGNSGGPLADALGRVVGINSMVANDMALAVPSARALRFVARADVRAA